MNRQKADKVTFFSQNGQDKFLEKKIFHNIKNGYFVDIGANDGISYSNTYFFENKGWKGLCVEPIPEIFEKLQKNRICECICGAVSDQQAEYSDFLHITGALEMLSGIINKYEKNHIARIDKEMYKSKEEKKIIQVKNYHFNQIVKNKNIDYLSIDVEGSEFDIIKNIDFSKFEIKVISIENDYGNKNILNLLKNYGFSYLTKIGSDEIYINKKYRYLLKGGLLTCFNLHLRNFFKKIKKIIKQIWTSA
ncbi:MAG: FkbM family methyltransferase [Patescibacteria group bacterium]|jgi:FkbM family methyltransferase